MASAGIGGVPTTTKRTYSRTGPSGAFDEVVYTCPANTLAYVTLDYLRKFGDTDAMGFTVSIRRTMPSGNVITSQIYSKAWTTTSPQTDSFATAMNMTPDQNLTRLSDNSQLNALGNIVGEFKMFPGETLIFGRTGSADNSMEAVFYTTEVSSNS